MEMTSVTSRSSLQLSRPISFGNQLNVNKDLNGNKISHFQIPSTPVETDVL